MNKIKTRIAQIFLAAVLALGVWLIWPMLKAWILATLGQGEAQ